MHRSIRENLEDVLARPEAGTHVQEHLKHCQSCSSEVLSMREQARLLRGLRAEAEPRPGFYARVMERIEAQGPVSIWSVFGESAFSRSIAAASMVLALLLGTYLVTAERAEQNVATRADGSALVWDHSGAPDRAAVLVNLVTYQEQ